jgi:hypothetical protein
LAQAKMANRVINLLIFIALNRKRRQRFFNLNAARKTAGEVPIFAAWKNYGPKT